MYYWNNNKLFKRYKRNNSDDPFPVEILYTQERINVDKTYEFDINPDKYGIYHAVFTA